MWEDPWKKKKEDKISQREYFRNMSAEGLAYLRAQLTGPEDEEADILAPGFIALEPLPVFPVMPLNLNANQRKAFEHNEIKIWQIDTARVKAITDDVEKESLSCSAEIKENLTSSLTTKLLTVFPTTRADGRIWSSCRDITQTKLKSMIQEFYTQSTGVLPEHREQFARKSFNELYQTKGQTIDDFANEFRDAVIEFESIVQPAMTEYQKCHHFLNKLDSKFVNIRAQFAQQEAIKLQQMALAFMPVPGFGFPDTLDNLITQIIAAEEVTHNVSGQQARSFAMLGDYTNKRGRGGRGGQGGKKGQSSRSNQGSGIQPNRNILTHQDGSKKNWEDINENDNPLDYGRTTCFKCAQMNKVGLHFTKFHK